MDAAVLLDELRHRGIDLIPDGGGRLIARPSSLLTHADREAIRQHKLELIALLTEVVVRETTAIPGSRLGEVIEMTLRPVTDAPPEFFTDVELPPCPVCGATRYWISRGMARCGTKTCLSASRFVVTSLKFHAVQ